MTTKSLVWVGSARTDLVSFLMPRDGKPDATSGWSSKARLLAIGAPCRTWAPASSRSGFTQAPSIGFYVAKFEEAVYVLHAFDKTTRATSKRDLDTGRARYAQTLARRSRHR